MRQPIPFGKYLLLDRISVGGMAEVFKAKSYGVEGFEKVIAIKRILPSMGEDRDFIKMFIDEAKIAGQLAHANICQIFELGRIDGAHFIAMEYIWGKDLLQIQNRYRKLGQVMPVPMASYIIARVCEGLEYAHRKKDALGRPLNIVHRDCSPQNVLISYEGEVKIIDFGIAKASSRASRTLAGVLKGKFGYMSPEQVRGLPLDCRSDIFALGTVLYESLTGERLFTGKSDFSTLEKVRNADITPPSLLNRNIPDAVERIVMKALTKDPDDRYQSCAEMRADLQQFLMTQPEVFTANTLAGWLKQAFAAELAHERELMERYKTLGRDGLIQGKPQAEAKLDVVQYLGEPGVADGDPTVLGGPTFDDIIEDRPSVPVPAGMLRQQDPGDDFEEVPTELFGEIEELDAEVAAVEGIASPAGEARLPEVFPRAPSAVPVIVSRPWKEDSPGASGVVVQLSPSPRGPEASASQQADLAFPATANVAPLPFAALANGSAAQATAEATPLPAAEDLETEEHSKTDRRKRPSVAKDIGIGVGIAVMVLALFAGGKWLLLGDSPGTREAQASGMGTIAVAIPGTARADVYVDDEKVGVVEGGEALTLEPRPVGEYHIRVQGPGMGCERRVMVEAGRPSFVTCNFSEKPVTGRLTLSGITDEHTILVDGQQISAEAAREPLSLSPGEEHTVTVVRSGVVVKKLAPTVVAGQELYRDLSDLDGSGLDVAVLPIQDEEDHRRAAPRRNEERSQHEALEPDDGSTEEGSTADEAREAEGNAESGGGMRKPRKREDAAGQPKKPDSELGFLIANTTPWGARVYVDGRDTKMRTPIAMRRKIPLKPGKHRVVFELNDTKYPYTVTIEAGETFKLVKPLDTDTDTDGTEP